MRKLPIWTTAPGLLWVAFFFALLIAGCAEHVEIPDNIKEQSTYQDPQLLQDAWSLPVAATYRNKIVYQSNGAFCGPASVVNVFNSTGFNSFTQSTLFDSTEVSYWKARLFGLTLEELTQIVRDTSPYKVEKLGNLTREEFRQHLLQANDPRYRYIINFSRLPLFGVAIGHHSPIGGYIADRDLVLVLDVLAEYKPYLVSGNRLYEAMNTVDSESLEKRGLILVHVTKTTRPDIY